jgi:hypothetical protein
MQRQCRVKKGEDDLLSGHADPAGMPGFFLSPHAAGSYFSGQSFYRWVFNYSFQK